MNSDWRKKPATSSQLTAIRNFYATSMGWMKAQGYVHSLGVNGMTRGEASDELNRLHNEKIHGHETAPIGWRNEEENK